MYLCSSIWCVLSSYLYSPECYLTHRIYLTPTSFLLYISEHASYVSWFLPGIPFLWPVCDSLLSFYPNHLANDTMSHSERFKSLLPLLQEHQIPLTVVLHMVEAAGFASPPQCSLHSQGTDYGNKFQACKTAGKCQWGTLRTNNTHSPLPRYKFKIWCSTCSHLEVKTERRQKVYTSGTDSQTSVQQNPFVINMYKWPQAC